MTKITFDREYIDNIHGDAVVAQARQNPVAALERAIAHVGKRPSFATGDAITLLVRAKLAIRKNGKQSAYLPKKSRMGR